MKPLNIHPDIRHAHTLPAAFYRDPAYAEAVKEKIFAKSWHYALDLAEIAAPGQAIPFTLLENILDEPLVACRGKEGALRVMSNVCTHRGNIVVEKPGTYRMLTCRYHGRCFRLDGTCKSMPAFEQVDGFPGTEDHLPAVPAESWMGMLFTGLAPIADLEEMTRPIRERLAWLPLSEMTFDPASSRNYTVNANWALYCDNYLEGLHIPFVHPALNQALDFAQYEYEVYPYCNLQIGIAGENEPCFPIPAGHPDSGRRIYAYYYWLFPNLMFNFYPWGLSLNVVEPKAKDKTLVRFRTYRFPDALEAKSLGGLNQTEMEDEEVVLSVQRGVRSRLYKRGRFSPSMEQGVHHFHRLIADFLNA